MYVCSVPACWRECGRGAVGDGLQCVLWCMDTAGEIPRQCSSECAEPQPEGAPASGSITLGTSCSMGAVARKGLSTALSLTAAEHP